LDTKNAVIGAVIVVLAISAIMNYMLYNQVRHLDQQVSTLQSEMNVQNTESQTQNKTQNQEKPAYELSTDNESKKSITAVAVRQIPTNDFFQSYTFEGTTMKITVEIKAGDGKILVNTATATGVDFQSSARTAVETAQNIANIDLSGSDVIFSIESESDIQAVDGPSAGGAMTVLLISELTHRDIRTDVLMTGTINPDGSVGRVGGIMEKADAAGKYGAKIFLVPDKQSTVKVESCEEKKVGPALYRTCKFEPANLSEITHDKYGMDVIEIKNIQEALSYFTE
jgi:uncharacterized protein